MTAITLVHDMHCMGMLFHPALPCVTAGHVLWLLKKQLGCCSFHSDEAVETAIHECLQIM